MSALVRGFAPPSVVFRAIERGEALAAADDAMDVDAPVAPQKKAKKAKTKKRRAAPKAQPRRGSAANVYWRAIPMRAVRAHPLYRSLPPQREVVARGASSNAPKLAVAAALEQDTWRWDALHAGRLTGARVAAACGLLEADAALKLRVPRSLSGHGRAVAAAQHLRHRVDAEGVVAAVFAEGDYDDEKLGDASCWAPGRGLYAVDYVGGLDGTARAFRDPSSARMAWGKTQEGVGVLAAVNFIDARHRGACVVAETGMLPGEHADAAIAELLEAAWLPPGGAGVACLEALRFRLAEAAKRPPPRAATAVPIGASPDGVVVYGDGSLDVLEVKSVAPFSRATGAASMELRDRGPHDALATWHVPQLMLEIHAAGSLCGGAVVASVSATRGACFLRVPRDDAYIRAMLDLLDAFYERFCGGGDADPPACFNADLPGFDDFVDRTNAIAANATLLGRTDGVQRARCDDRGFFLA